MSGYVRDEFLEQRRQFNKAFRALGLRPRNFVLWLMKWRALPNYFIPSGPISWPMRVIPRQVEWSVFVSGVAVQEFGRDRMRREAKRHYKNTHAAKVDVLAYRWKLQRDRCASYYANETYSTRHIESALLSDRTRSLVELRKNVRARQLAFLESLGMVGGRTGKAYAELLARKRSHELLSSPFWWKS